MLTENKKPKCARKAPITMKPIVKIKRDDLKSLIADFLILQYSSLNKL